jgi:predicted transposase/invertase (TIGR01784 family)
MKAKYVNPFTDFGFKKIFGEEASKPVLMDFLNALLPAHHAIAELTFKNTEQLGRSEFERKAVYDIYCESATGEKFIVELQKAKQNYFRERTIYYSTFPIREQAERGNWDYNLKAVYCVGILDFTFDDDEIDDDGTEPRNEVRHTITLKDQHGKPFYDKLTYIYLEMPNFQTPENGLTTRLDKWLYFIKHLEDFQAIPTIFRDAVFHQAFATAELATLSGAELDRYEASLKVFRDNNAVLDYAQKTAFDEGKLEGKLEVARALKASGVEASVIAAATGLALSEIAAL